ncbi:MAG: hypothetical protein KGI50_00910 [Patescibacteria group bacterium]|nr:hypothetical protein [Patescibacteria group bacterium]MDE2438087.1 hypothetical protein [Patescibacteria group bacterium]
MHERLGKCGPLLQILLSEGNHSKRLVVEVCLSEYQLPIRVHGESRDDFIEKAKHYFEERSGCLKNFFASSGVRIMDELWLTGSLRVELEAQFLFCLMDNPLFSQIRSIELPHEIIPDF